MRLLRFLIFSFVMGRCLTSEHDGTMVFSLNLAIGSMVWGLVFSRHWLDISAQVLLWMMISEPDQG